MQIHTVNPATGEKLEDYPRMSHEEVGEILSAVQGVGSSWAATPLEDRLGLLGAAADLLREGKDEHAALMAREMGKPLDQGVSEAEKCAWVCEYYADHAPAFLADEAVDTDAARSYVAYRPLGVLLAVMPWNFPYWQVFRFAAPALAAGNTAVLKHAANVTGCALRIEKIFREAGFPEHVFRTLVTGHEEVERAIGGDIVRGVTLTGSVQAGRNVAPAAGAALKPTVLELGGSDPYLVLEDADLEAAVEACVTSRLLNSGQSCIAAKRFLVVEQVASELTERFVASMQAKKMDDPFTEDVDLGPQARRDLRDDLHSQVLRSVAAGAEILCGGSVPDRKGAWYPPTVLAEVRPGMAAFDEETFGPVAAIVRVRNEAEAVALANQSSFGLGAAVFTGDQERGERIAREELEAGCCFVNDFVRSDPRLPFGGVKSSGYGRELARHGIHEWVNAKTVWVA